MGSFAAMATVVDAQYLHTIKYEVDGCLSQKLLRLLDPAYTCNRLRTRR